MALDILIDTNTAQGQEKSVADEDQCTHLDEAQEERRMLTELPAMDVDSGATKKASGKGKRVEKRRSKRKSSIVFPSYKERQQRKK